MLYQLSYGTIVCCRHLPYLSECKYKHIFCFCKNFTEIILTLFSKTDIKQFYLLIYVYYRNQTGHPLRRRERPNQTPLRGAVVAALRRILQLVSCRGRQGRTDRYGRRGLRIAIHEQHRRGVAGARDRLSGSQPHGGRPLGRDGHAAHALSPHADRRQRQDVADDRGLLRNYRQYALHQGGRVAVAWRQDIAVLYGAYGALARGHGYLLPRAARTILGRCFRYVRHARRRHPRHAARARPFLGRNGALLRLHRRQVRQTRAGRIEEAGRARHRDDLLDTRSGLDARYRQGDRHIRPSEPISGRAGRSHSIRFNVRQHRADGRAHSPHAGCMRCRPHTPAQSLVGRYVGRAQRHIRLRHADRRLADL